MPSSDFPGFAGQELQNVLRLVEVRGWVWTFVPHSAGSEFRDGHYHIFYRRDRAGMLAQPASAMVRSAEKVMGILQVVDSYKYAEEDYPTSFWPPALLKREGTRVLFDLRGKHAP